MVPKYTLAFFKGLFARFLRNNAQVDGKAIQRDEKSLFGVSSLVAYAVWESIYISLPNSSQPEHLLWALIFLKTYSSERTHSLIAQCDPKTFRKRSWEFVMYISNLTTVRILLLHSLILINFVSR